MRNFFILLIIAFIVAIPVVTKTYEGKGQQSVRVIKDISYHPDFIGKAASSDTADTSRLLDLYLPGKSLTGSVPPLVVFIHGGAWLQGDKSDSPGLFLAERGYACASINYRLSTQKIFPAQLEDCREAIRFLRKNAANYGYDGNRIAVWGNSAGGHLAALIGTTGDTNPGTEVKAVIDWCGLSNLESVANQAGSRTILDYETLDGPVARLLGGLVKDKQELAKAASPVNFVNANDPPFLLVHGDIDNVVPYAQSEELARALTKAQVPHKLLMIQRASHSLGGEEEISATLEFLKQNL